MPNELMIQILLRLPVKSLIRFKCVCKSWFSLISSDSHFANSHFQLSPAKHTRRVLFISTSARLTRSIDVDASLDHDSASLNIHFLLPESYSDLQIKGSCRGFILLHCSLTLSLYLWNPSTGFHKKIPLPPFASHLDDGIDYFYGFWYDPLTDDYLVVSMSVHPSHLEIFSLRANTWKEEIHFTQFSCVGVSEFEPKPGLFFNGAIHWFAFHLGLRLDVIISFDLIKRKLFYIHFPDEFNREPHDCGLWVFGEFFSFWAMDYDNDTVEIWVMKEYKVHSSWTKTRVLPFDGIFLLYPFSLYALQKAVILLEQMRLLDW